MRERYIAPAIMLVAGAITSVLNIINETDFYEGLKRLFITLLLFYIIGKIATKIIMKAVSMNKESEEQKQPNEDQKSGNPSDIKEE